MILRFSCHCSNIALIFPQFKILNTQTYFDHFFWKWGWRIVKQLLEVLVKELKDKCELLVGVQHIHQAHDVRVL